MLSVGIFRFTATAGVTTGPWPGEEKSNISGWIYLLTTKLCSAKWGKNNTVKTLLRKPQLKDTGVLVYTCKSYYCFLISWLGRTAPKVVLLSKRLQYQLSAVFILNNFTVSFIFWNFYYFIVQHSFCKCHINLFLGGVKCFISSLYGSLLADSSTPSTNYSEFCVCRQNKMLTGLYILFPSTV